MYNSVKREVINVIGPSISYVPLTLERYSLIDSEDAGRVSGPNWSAKRSAYECYPRKHVKDGVRKYRKVYLHHVVMNVTEPSRTVHVDHINGNALDNRKCNLRICLRRENCRNTRISTKNTSGYKGVISTPSGKWLSQIQKDGKNNYLGIFATKEEAHAAYCLAAKQLFGEFARAI